MNKKKKIILTISILLLVVILGVGGLVGNYFYNLALNPFTSKDMIFGDDDDDTSLEVEADVNWLIKDSNYIDTYITSSDNLKLHAYEVKNENKTDKWAIVVHGYTSEGKLLSSKALHGTSMGSATVLMVSGEKLPSNVKAIVADCGYTSVYDEFSYQLKQLFNLPAFPIMNFSDVVTHIRAGYCLNDASAINQVKKSTTPILYIHGDKDDFVPYYMMDELYNATNSEKEKLTIEGGEHANSDLVNPKLYWSTVNSFLEKYIEN